MIQIILREAIPALGEAGEVVGVRPGYARNFLIPRGLAVVADPTNLRMLAHERRMAAARQARMKGVAETLAQRLAGMTLVFSRASGAEGKLFGSVTAQEIMRVLQEREVSFERRCLRLQEPIKAVGTFEVEVRLHPEVRVPLRISVEAIASGEDLAEASNSLPATDDPASGT